jgi:hypothetical protein
MPRRQDLRTVCENRELSTSSSACPGAICDTTQATECDGTYGPEKLDGIAFHTIFQPLYLRFLDILLS